ncbi:hypothetical protein VTJ49DRAFT_4390 [Mycothermus thermophilus]|uniref:Uncharacterized protein n=1 Tax=Humicola insolens TaxID=85995 RepID=A0ABR3V5M9_HUMIN
MPASLDSSRPIMAPSARTSVRFSTYSMNAPSITPTVVSTDSVNAEIRPIVDGLERLRNPRLADDQRVLLTETKSTELADLALKAKLERALDRRMTSQDAVMRPRRKSSVTLVAAVPPAPATAAGDVEVTDEKQAL